jgi:hypothetical protein
MTAPVLTLRLNRNGRSLAPAEPRDCWVRRRVGIAWGLLVLNVLTFIPGGSVLPIPGVVGKAITQGSLLVALFMALTVNRRVIVRPNVFLFLVSLLVVEAVLTSMHAQYLLSTTYRTFRLAEFVVTLWLLSPFWGRSDLLLVRCHLRAMVVVLASVVLGLVVAPSHALVAGRLGGVIWPMPPTQVAHYAAVTLGLVIVLWLSGQGRGRITLLTVVGTGAILLLTHTRTALAAMVAGLLVAGLSLIAAKSRVRRIFAAAGAVAAIVTITLSGVITTWLARGEGTAQLTDLSGRTKLWAPLVAFPRDKVQELFGFGLSNDSFNGQPIDSNWLASYQEQGLLGVAVCATILIFLLIVAYFQPRGVQRALALFLVTYCLLASFTEVGLTSASSYLLDLTVAASLLVPTIAAGGRNED